jgi:hypothetical protein
MKRGKYHSNDANCSICLMRLEQNACRLIKSNAPLSLQPVTVSLPLHRPPPRLPLAAQLSYSGISPLPLSKPSPMCLPHPPARLAARTSLSLLCTITTRMRWSLAVQLWPRRTVSRNNRTAFRSDTRLLGRVVCGHTRVAVNLIHEKKVTKWELHDGNY